MKPGSDHVLHSSTVDLVKTSDPWQALQLKGLPIEPRQAHTCSVHTHPRGKFFFLFHELLSITLLPSTDGEVPVLHASFSCSSGTKVGQ
jgi:hypothetical protein